ncbi:Pyruvate/2-oxoglutarate dehydrogenase complex, dihydrolipoamide dehydrogenase (E3) component [Dyadobacter koreensis]|uniref:Pyruvate/2-oxoglutarate dehydrogenase complex, dihydrolipoamide dehydrogenase (E3) component n=1 Tax=Dyadobacter koreensis TaxID=408657 RepID=A0A1H7AQW5_9BACT|nr:mercuric reductase [Dyadobacter koreensis]SEJ67336.1 Pyruvate/2-oxoglutarate dehydrogenase complex, dihydrolipoamide dehydrogenase (E3) component [Dyadobacter koreensis]
MEKYDAIVIGSGQAGTPLSKRLAESGLKTAIIEKRWVGGTCVNDGCSPTKTMIASAKLAWSVANSEKLGVHVGGYTVDFHEILDRKNEVVQRMRGNSEKGIKETKNLDLIYGTAVFTGPKEITVTLNDGSEQVLSADKFFINVGEKPAIPEIDGIDKINYLTSTSIMELEEIPEHLAIIGSGYIALEFGQMFRRFGSKVTILEQSERILRHEDEDIAEEIVKILSEEDIKIITDCKVELIKNEGHNINLFLNVTEQEANISCTHVLIGAGRKPQTTDLGLDSAGVEIDEKGYVKVNDKLETSVEGIYALGDVKGGPAFTHIAYDDYRVIRKNIIEKGNESIKDRLVPYCMFIDPQLGRVGITEQEAKESGKEVLVAKMPNSSVARSIETGDTRGMMKAVIDKETGKILGASVLAEEGGEIVTILQLAMMGGITYEQLKEGVFAHPTYAESLNNLFMTLDK